MKQPAFAKESDLVAAFVAANGSHIERKGYTAYHETAGWDLLLAHSDGHQIGVEAKLKLNPKVLVQALPPYRWSEHDKGPDFRAVLVPSDGLQAGMTKLAWYLGINVISQSSPDIGKPWRTYASVELPEDWQGSEIWHPWFPVQRCELPEYVPDVVGGSAAPVQLSKWKIQAIKMLILLERRGAVSRADFKALRLSPTRWLDPYYGYLMRTPAGYVACTRTPDLKAVHPTIWPQIEADFDTWAPPARPGLVAAAPELFEPKEKAA